MAETYSELPSSAIEFLELDWDTNTVKIVYKSNLNKQYHYKCEDLDEFQSAFMTLCGKLEAEQDRDDDDQVVEDITDTIEREDASIGKFINERRQLGNLKIDTILTQHDDMLDKGWDGFVGSTVPDGALVNVDMAGDIVTNVDQEEKTQLPVDS